MNYLSNYVEHCEFRNDLYHINSVYGIWFLCTPLTSNRQTADYKLDHFYTYLFTNIHTHTHTEAKTKPFTNTSALTRVCNEHLHINKFCRKWGLAGLGLVNQSRPRCCRSDTLRIWANTYLVNTTHNYILFMNGFKYID